MYLGSCASYLSNGGTPCHALSSLANTCTTCDEVCVKPSTCPVCVDESGKGRFVGESWTKSDNLCVTSTCTNDGNIVQMTAACDAPKTCQPNEITKTIATNTCCQVTECIPQETCKDVKCPVFEKPICGVAEEI